MKFRYIFVGAGRIFRIFLSWLFVLGAVSAAHSPSAFASGPVGMAIQGTLYDPSGAFVLIPNVNFKLQVLDKSGMCILFEESHNNVDLVSTSGEFSLELGGGSNRQNRIDGSTELKENVFRNDISPVTVTGCTGDVTFASGDERLVRVSFNLGFGQVTLTPDVKLLGGAYASVAGSLSGKTAVDFVQIRNDTNTLLTQANLESTFSSVNYPKLQSLLTTNWSSQVGGKNVDLSGVAEGAGEGRVLTWDATGNRWTTALPSTSATSLHGRSIQNVAPNPSEVLKWNGFAWMPAPDLIGITGFTGDMTASGTSGTVSVTIQPNAVSTAKIANNAITSAKISSIGVAINRLLITDGTTGSTLGYATCASVNQVMSWTANGWQCASLSVIAPVTSVAGKTGAVTLNAADIVGLGTAAIKNAGTGANEVVSLDGSARLPAVDGFALTNVNASLIGGRAVASATPSANQVLTWNGSRWEPAAVLTNGSVNINTVGTITTGTWTANIVGVPYGGTGTNNGSITGTGALTFTAGGSNQNVTLTPSGTGHTIINGNVGLGILNPPQRLAVGPTTAGTTLLGQTPTAKTMQVNSNSSVSSATSADAHDNAFISTTNLSGTYAYSNALVSLNAVNQTPSATYSGIRGSLLMAEMNVSGNTDFVMGNSSTGANNGGHVKFLYGSSGAANSKNAGTLTDNSYGLLAASWTYDSATTTNAYGVRTGVTAVSSGTITNGYGIYLTSSTGTGGTIANLYDVYASTASAKNYFAGNVGIGTTSPGATLDVKGAIRLSGSTSGFTGFQPAAAAGSTVWTLPTADGTAGQVLKTNGSGVLGWVDASSGSVTAVNATAPIASSGGSTPTISISQANGTTNGYLSSGDWTTFNGKAPLASPAFTGTPTAPTAAADTNTTQLATTAYVIGQASSINPLMNGIAASGTTTKWSREDHVHPTDSSRAPAAGSTSITTLGTITTGTWNGSVIGVPYGGTGTSDGSITGTGALTFAAGGSNQNVTLTPSGTGATILNGNVGIGTTNPRTPLEVSGSVYFNATAGDSYLTAAIDASALSISANAVTGMPTSGIMRIGDEFVRYSGISGTTITLTQRGLYGTTAASHPQFEVIASVPFVIDIQGSGNYDQPMFFIDGDGSIALGGGKLTGDQQQVVIGSFASAAGAESVAVGPFTNVNGRGSAAIGYSSGAQGDSAFAAGAGAWAGADSAIAVGAATATAMSSIAIGGFGVESLGKESMAVGTGVKSHAYMSTVTGTWNTLATGANTTTWVATDPHFVIGNGQTMFARSNALMLLKNGNVGLGQDAPTAKLTVNGHMHFSGASPTATCGGVAATVAGNDSVGRLTTNGAGNTTCTVTFASAWANAPICFGQIEGEAAGFVSSVTTTAVTFQFNSMNTGWKVSYRCDGYQ